jgi:hypothetical protein
VRAPTSRVAALVVAALLLALLSTSGGVALAAPASGALDARPNADGTTSLTWTLRGTSDEINVLPHLRCPVDPTADGPFAGARVPCLWIVDHEAAYAPGPDGCAAVDGRLASWRCDMRRFRDVTIDAAEAGESSLIMLNTLAGGGSGVCAWIPLAIRLGGGSGEVRAADGCPQVITCAPAYAGTITRDRFDRVTGCRAVRGATAGSASPGTDGAACAAGTAERTSRSPLERVAVALRGRRGMRIAIRLRRAALLHVDIEARGARGWRRVRRIDRCGRAGANVVRVGDATGGRRGARNYRVVVRSPASAYPLRSSWTTLPRS